MDRPKDTQGTVADAARRNWVDTVAPPTARPLLRLARFDRPIGAWLLLWPCWWSVALAARQAPEGWRWAVTGAGANGEGLPDPILLLLFLVGAFTMRAAGCVWNDILDRDLDAQVARTASRPLASGQVTLRTALTLLVVLLLVGLAVLLTFNAFAIELGFLSMIVVVLYPFAKRVTFWPQAVLGLAFAWGALMGWAAFTGALAWAPVLLYAGAIAWVIGYDTIYAHQDKEDDAIVGIKSTALKFGERTKPMVALFYGIAFAGICAAAYLARVPTLPFAALALACGVQLTWQVADLKIDDPADCLAKFRSNHLFGLFVFLAIVVANVYGGFLTLR